MLLRFAAASTGLALFGGLTAPVVADGVGVNGYNYLKPPSYLESSNQQPAIGRGVIALRARGSDSEIIETYDAQAAVKTNIGSVRSIAGQTGIRIDITPTGHYPKPPMTFGGFARLSIIGNSYAFRITYVPSGKPVTHLAKPVTISLLFPNTPDLLLGSNGGPWHQLCSLKSLSRAVNSLSCSVRRIPREVIMLRSADTHSAHVSRTVKSSRDLFVFVLVGGIAVVLIGISWVVYRAFTRKPQGQPTTERPASVPPPRPRQVKRRRRR